MPNQRSKNKIYLGGFIEKQLHARIVQMATEAGMAKNKFGFAARLIEEAIERRTRRRTSRARRSRPKG